MTEIFISFFLNDTFNFLNTEQERERYFGQENRTSLFRTCGPEQDLNRSIDAKGSLSSAQDSYRIPDAIDRDYGWPYHRTIHGYH